MSQWLFYVGGAVLVWIKIISATVSLLLMTAATRNLRRYLQKVLTRLVRHSHLLREGTT